MRLIDADNLTDVINRSYLTQGEKRLFNIKIRHAPTVTPDKIQAIMSDYLIYRCEPERPQGEWIPNDKISPWGNPGRSCSLCGKIVEFSENFCPKCGADMRGIYNGKEETT